MAKYTQARSGTALSKYTQRQKQTKHDQAPVHTTGFPIRPLQPITAPDLHTIVTLQSTIGNTAVQRLLHHRYHTSTSQTAPIRPSLHAFNITKPRTRPPWAANHKKTRAIQRFLKHLGTYLYNIDGVYGPYTDSALVETFGGDSFRTMDYATTLARVRAARPLKGTRGQRLLRYGEMFRDGVLDITIGIGHDERGHDKAKLAGICTILKKRGFTQNISLAQKLYAQIGRRLVKSPAYMYFVKKDALKYTPPAGKSRPIHVVVRIISNTGDLYGAMAVRAFMQGLAHSDITYYTGHGRYGSGPDFDRNFESFSLFDKGGRLQIMLLDYHALHKFLKQEGQKYGRSAWSQFLWRVRHERIKVKLRNTGNIFINPYNYHKREFGARLIYWALKSGHARLASGRHGAIEKEMKTARDQHYRVVVFAGCRTRNYHRRLRQTPGFDTGAATLFETTKTIKTADATKIFGAFLNSILNQLSAQAIARAMDMNQPVQRRNRGVRYLRGTFRSSDSRYDPVVP